MSGAGAAGAAAGNGAAAGGDAGGQGEAANGHTSTQTNGGPDVSALTETLSQMQQSQEQMREYLASNPWAQSAQPAGDADEGEPGNLDLSFLDDDGYGDGGDPDEFGAEPGSDDETAQMVEGITDATSHYLQAAMEPIAREMGEVRQQIADVREERGWHDLVTEFPDIANAEYMEPLFKAARDFGDVHGLPAKVAASPAMLRTLYLAEKGLEAAREEAEQLEHEQPSAAHLEGGAGAGPAASRSPGDDYLQALAPRGGGLFD
jgi:hypothetical protein